MKCKDCEYVYLFIATNCKMCPWKELRCSRLSCEGEDMAVKPDWFCANFEKRNHPIDEKIVI